MAWLAIVAFIVPWWTAHSLAKWWKRGLFAPIAAIVGAVCGMVATFAIGLTAHYLNPEVFPADDVILSSLGFAWVSAIISPFAAFYGWRKAKKST